MRYTMDPFLKSEFEKRIKQFETQIKSHPNCPDDDTSTALLELAKGWFEIGFENGCGACAPLSPLLTDIYGDVTTTGQMSNGG